MSTGIPLSFTNVFKKKSAKIIQVGEEWEEGFFATNKQTNKNRKTKLLERLNREYKLAETKY